MKHTFISLLFFILLGIITLSTSSPEVHSRQESKQQNITQELQKVITQGCLDLPPKEKFNNSNYFRGEWYLSRYYVLNFPRKDEITSFCVYKRYELSWLGRATEYFHHYSIRMSKFGGEHHQLFSETNHVMYRNFSGKYYLRYGGRGDVSEESTSNCHKEVTVLDTDYNSYSIEYSCGRLASIDSASVIQIYIRKSHIVDEKIETSLKKFGLKIEDFKLSLSQYCHMHDA